MSMQILSSPSVSSFQPSLSSTYDYIDTKAREISQLFYDHVIYPMGVGAAAGICDFVFCCGCVAVQFFFSSFGIELIEAVEEEVFDYFFEELFFSSLIIPIIEEVLFRVCIQGSIKWIAAQILPDQEIDILGYLKLPLPALVSIVATSILFGAMHYSNGGMILAVSATVAGVNFGLLKEQVGLLSSITAHGVTNGLLIIVDAITSS